MKQTLYQKEYRLKNIDKIKLYLHNYWKENKENISLKRKEEKRLYREAHKTEAKQYREEHKEQIKLYKKEYREINREKLNECDKQYQRDNKSKCNERSRKHYENHKDEYFERAYKRHRNIVIVEHVYRAKLKDMYDGKCVYCGQELGSKFHTDHLLPVSRYEKIGKKCPHSYDNCVPTCISCNESKHDKTPLEFMWANTV